MRDSGATHVSLTTFSRGSMQRRAGAHLDEVLAHVDREALTLLHVVHAEAKASATILECFGLPRGLAEKLDGPAALGLDSCTGRYLLKKFSFIERSAKPPEPAERSAVLRRHAETNRFTESSGTAILGEKYLLLFENQASALLAKAVDASLERESEVRTRGVAYLLYRLTKAIFIDNYFALLQELTGRAQELETRLLEGDTDRRTYREVTRLRGELSPLARSMLYAAEFAGAIRGERPEVLTREGADDLTENFRSGIERLRSELSILRETTSQLIQTYRDNGNAELNNIMRTLTAISAMFLPLSFITSFYGMNFTNMPALKWSGSFFIVIAAMVAIVVGFVIYARRHKWI